MTMEVDGEAVKVVAKEGFDPVYGARPLRRAIQNCVEDAVAEKLLDGSVKEGDHILGHRRERARSPSAAARRRRPPRQKNGRSRKKRNNGTIQKTPIRSRREARGFPGGIFLRETPGSGCNFRLFPVYYRCQYPAARPAAGAIRKVRNDCEIHFNSGAFGGGESPFGAGGPFGGFDFGGDAPREE